MARKLEVEIIGDAASLERAFGRAGKSTQGLGSSLMGLGKVAAVGIAGLTVASGFLGKKLVDLAGDAAEVESKFRVVFGREMPGMIKQLDAFSEATGASRYQLREQTADMGALLEPLSASKKLAGEMSVQFVKLATDLSSFNNVPVADALLAIRSGLVGEAEPLRRFGVLLNEAAVKAEAVRMGLVKQKEELTEQQKVQARANLIMEQTKLAQGDAIRTSDSYANQVRRLQNSLRDLGTDMGKVLLPAMTAVVSFLNNEVVPAFSKVAGYVSSFWKRIGAEVSKAPNVRAKVNIVWEGVEQAVSDLVRIIGDKITSLLSSKPLPVTNARLEARGLTIEQGVDWEAIAADMLSGLSAALGKSAELAKALASTVTRSFREVDWLSVGRAAGPGLTTALVAAFAALLDPVFWVKNWDLTLAVAAVAFAGPLGRFASSIATKFGGAIFAQLARISPEVAAAFGRLFDDAVRVAAIAVENMGRKLTALITAVFGRLTKIALFTIKVLGVDAAINAIVDFASRMGRVLSDAATTAAKAAYTIGASIVSGVKDGIVAGWDALMGWIQSQFEKLPWPVRKILGMHSPSKVFIDIGKSIGEGLLMGIDAGMATVPQKLADKVGQAIDAARQAIESRRSVFESAFDGLVSAALSAFDRLTQEFETKTERKIRLMDERAAAAERKRAIIEAEKDLQEARATAAALPLAGSYRRKSAFESGSANCSFYLPLPEYTKIKRGRF